LWSDLLMRKILFLVPVLFCHFLFALAPQSDVNNLLVPGESPKRGFGRPEGQYLEPTERGENTPNWGHPTIAGLNVRKNIVEALVNNLNSFSHVWAQDPDFMEYSSFHQAFKNIDQEHEKNQQERMRLELADRIYDFIETKNHGTFYAHKDMNGNILAVTGYIRREKMEEVHYDLIPLIISEDFLKEEYQKKTIEKEIYILAQSIFGLILEDISLASVYMESEGKSIRIHYTNNQCSPGWLFWDNFSKHLKLEVQREILKPSKHSLYPSPQYSLEFIRETESINKFLNTSEEELNKKSVRPLFLMQPENVSGIGSIVRIYNFKQSPNHYRDKIFALVFAPTSIALHIEQQSTNILGKLEENTITFKGLQSESERFTIFIDSHENRSGFYAQVIANYNSMFESGNLSKRALRALMMPHYYIAKLRRFGLSPKIMADPAKNSWITAEVQRRVAKLKISSDDQKLLIESFNKIYFETAQTASDNSIEELEILTLQTLDPVEKNQAILAKTSVSEFVKKHLTNSDGTPRYSNLVIAPAKGGPPSKDHPHGTGDWEALYTLFTERGNEWHPILTEAQKVWDQMREDSDLVDPAVSKFMEEVHYTGSYPDVILNLLEYLFHPKQPGVSAGPSLMVIRNGLEVLAAVAVEIGKPYPPEIKKLLEDDGFDTSYTPDYISSMVASKKAKGMGALLVNLINALLMRSGNPYLALISMVPGQEGNRSSLNLLNRLNITPSQVPMGTPFSQQIYAPIIKIQKADEINETEFKNTLSNLFDLGIYLATDLKDEKYWVAIQYGTYEDWKNSKLIIENKYRPYLEETQATSPKNFRLVPNLFHLNHENRDSVLKVYPPEQMILQVNMDPKEVWMQWPKASPETYYALWWETTLLEKVLRDSLVHGIKEAVGEGDFMLSGENRVRYVLTQVLPRIQEEINKKLGVSPLLLLPAPDNQIDKAA